MKLPPMAKVLCPYCNQPGDELLVSVACLTPGCRNYRPLTKSLKSESTKALPLSRDKCCVIENEKICGNESFVLCSACKIPVCGSHVVTLDRKMLCPACVGASAGVSTPV